MHNFYRSPYYNYRNNAQVPPNLPPPAAPPIPNPPPAKPCTPEEKHKKKQKKKFDLKCFKNSTCKSLNEVECFLNNFSDFIKYIKLINLLKK